MTELAHAHGTGTVRRPPLVLCWGGPDRPLPVQEVRSVGRAAPAVFGGEPPPWLSTGPAGEPFDFCSHIRRLCDDIVRCCPELGHVRTSGVLYAMTQARNGRGHGLQARVTPL